MQLFPYNCMDYPAKEIHYNIQVEALYWQARENGLEYVLANAPIQIPSGKFKGPDFQSHFGFRAHLAYLLPDPNLKFDFCFTHFHARNNSHLRADQKKVFFPIWTHPETNQDGFVLDVKNRWRLHLGFGDVSVYKHFTVSSWLNMNPYLGLRYAEVRQKTRTIYQGGSLFPNAENNISMKNKFWGVGPRLGCKADFYFCNPFSLYADFALSLLGGQFYIHQDQEIEERQLPLKFLDTFTQPETISETEIGLSYQYFSPKQTFAVQLAIGYEITYLFSQNQLKRFTSATEPAVFASQLGDLILQGWNFSLAFDF